MSGRHFFACHLQWSSGIYRQKLAQLLEEYCDAGIGEVRRSHLDKLGVLVFSNYTAASVYVGNVSMVTSVHEYLGFAA